MLESAHELEIGIVFLVLFFTRIGHVLGLVHLGLGKELLLARNGLLVEETLVIVLDLRPACLRVVDTQVALLELLEKVVAAPGSWQQHMRSVQVSTDTATTYGRCSPSQTAWRTRVSTEADSRDGQEALRTAIVGTYTRQVG